jgi:hypothetical protein
MTSELRETQLIAWQPTSNRDHGLRRDDRLAAAQETPASPPSLGCLGLTPLLVKVFPVLAQVATIGTKVFAVFPQLRLVLRHIPSVFA